MTPRGRGLSRGGARLSQVYRNRTLILNNNSSSSSTTEADASESSTPKMSWVSKSDRHLQLINPAVFEKQSQERAKAMEESRKLRLRRRDERERLKLSHHLLRTTAPAAHSFARGSNQAHEIIVEGIRFRVDKGGSKLTKILGENISGGARFGEVLIHFAGDENAAKSTPRTASVGGVMFYRSKNGNLYRSGAVKAQRYDLPLLRHLSRVACLSGRTNENHYSSRGAVKRVDEPCKIFSSTGSSFISQLRPRNHEFSDCLRFDSLGTY